MKIQQLTENKNDIFDEIFNSPFFKTNIEPYINSEENEDLIGNPLYHGSKKLTTDNTFKIIPLNRRKGPKDSAVFIHNSVNEKAVEVLGLPVRNLTFATTSLVTTQEYGEPYVMIPIGDYDLYYSTIVEDLYSNSEDIMNEDSRQQFMTNKLRKILESKRFLNTCETIAGIIGVKRLRLLVSTEKLFNRLPDLLEDFESIEEAYQDEYIGRYAESIYKVFINALYDSYDMSAVEEADDASTIHTKLYKLAQDMVLMSEKYDREWLDGASMHYIETIRKTKKTEDVPAMHEIMVDAEQVVFVPEDTWKATVIRQYLQRK